MSSQQPRSEMVNNAVSFLSDPSVSDTSLTKKIQFLEAKGMTNQEIQQALSIVQKNNSNSVEQQQMNATSTLPSVPFQVPAHHPNAVQYYAPPPPPAPRTLDWKDYIIMGTTTAGLIYGTYQVISRYILPRVLPPSKSKLDEDKESMEREFQRVEAILQKIETDQTEFIQRQDEKSKLIDEALIEVDAIVKATNEKNLRNEDTLKYLKLEIDSIKSTLMKNLEAQKSTISTELEKLEKKTESLKETLENHSSNEFEKATRATSVPHAPSPSPTPPPNLLTNNRSTSNVSTPTESSHYKLNIPPPSTIPSAKDILGSSKNKDNSQDNDKDNVSSNTETSQLPINAPQANIPAWQLASSQKANIGSGQSTTIPAWQLAAQEK